jgi:hypothetical protein
MHPFMFVGGVLHATLLLVVAFFIWFAAARATGWLRLFGKILGMWLVVLAIASILLGLFGIGHHHMRGWMAPGAAPAASTPADNSTPN